VEGLCLFRVYLYHASYGLGIIGCFNSFVLIDSTQVSIIIPITRFLDSLGYISCCTHGTSAKCTLISSSLQESLGGCGV
jgi:hypothetical protein